MRRLLAILAVLAVSGCELILGISDPQLVGSGGGTDIGADAGAAGEIDGAPPVGLACDVVTQNCPTQSDACYFDFARRTTFCAPVPSTALGIPQDGLCAGGMPCANDSCDKGFAPIGLENIEAFEPDRCAFFCAPVPTHTGNPSMAGGNPAFAACGSMFDNRPDGPGEPLYQCRFVNSFFPFFPPAAEVPDNIGMCVQVELFGDCTQCDLVSDPGSCAPGCVPAGSDGGGP